jgi:hypothetical protein
LSDLFKSITSLPSDATLISLPAGPLLELVCLAAQRHLTAVWLSLASMLIIQLDPPSLLPLTLKSEPNPEAQRIMSTIFPVLLQTSLSSLSQPGAMDAVSRSCIVSVQPWLILFTARTLTSCKPFLDAWIPLVSSYRSFYSLGRHPSCLTDCRTFYRNVLRTSTWCFGCLASIFGQCPVSTRAILISFNLHLPSESIVLVVRMFV